VSRVSSANAEPRDGEVRKKETRSFRDYRPQPAEKVTPKPKKMFGAWDNVRRLTTRLPDLGGLQKKICPGRRKDGGSELFRINSYEQNAHVRLRCKSDLECSNFQTQRSKPTKALKMWRKRQKKFGLIRKRMKEDGAL